MNASKKRYDNKWKVTRISLEDYAFIKTISQSENCSMAEALHKALVVVATEIMSKPAPVASKSPQRIPMPVTTAMSTPVTIKSIPVTTAGSTPVRTARRRSTPVVISLSREVENVTNGHRQAD